jgi:hypothetical protein
MTPTGSIQQQECSQQRLFPQPCRVCLWSLQAARASEWLASAVEQGQTLVASLITFLFTDVFSSHQVTHAPGPDPRILDFLDSAEHGACDVTCVGSV